MKRILILLVCLGLIGCGINSGVVKIGEDAYKINRRVGSGFQGATGIKEAALLEAGEFCVSQGKELKVSNIGGSHPPYIFGNFPKVEVQFKCIDPKDPILKQKDSELVTKIATLNKLLDEEIITKNEFEQRKQKLLDDHFD